jgi:hypothetical protein
MYRLSLGLIPITRSMRLRIRLVPDIAARISADEHTGKVQDTAGRVIGEFRVEEEGEED